MSSNIWLALTLAIDVLLYAVIWFLKKRSRKRSEPSFRERREGEGIITITQPARKLLSVHPHEDFRKKHPYSVAAGVAVFLVAATALFTYSHLRRNSYDSLMVNAQTFYDNGMYEHSLKAYTELSLLYPYRVGPFLGVALSSERMGRMEGAIEAYKRVLDLQPFDDFTQNELARVSRARAAGEEGPSQEM
ncbi:MAG: hypothetical protein LBR71_04605 [Synergistaceae bacterium]|jgi:tetratricopeptide (TPR) repeat protein|nr:hypothetical protein [Synergistaceae bacterium]